MQRLHLVGAKNDQNKRRSRVKTVFDVANYFITKDNQENRNSITPKKLQKLLYYAQASSLVFNDSPLFPNNFQAWEHGAVVPCVYRKYSDHKHKVIRYSTNSIDNNIDWSEAEINTLETTWRIYGSLSARELEDLNHSEMPWNRARGSLPPEAWCNEVIPKDEILFYHSQFIKSKKEYMYTDDITKENKSAKIEFRFADGTTHTIEREEAEGFIIENIDKFEKKKFSPKGKRRTKV